jgi:beta-phosphoglucomutase
MIQKNIQAFIFDMDGTLVDNSDFHTQAWLTLLNEIGIEIDAGELHRQNAGKTNAETFRGILGDSHSEEKLYQESYRPHIQPVRGLMAFLDQVRAMGIPLALATSAGQQNISLVLDGLGIRDYFAVVVGAEDIQKSKPHPEMFLTAAHRLGILPQSCLVFEDSPVGIEAARRAGMRTVVITTFLDPKELQGAAGILQAVPDFTHLEARWLISSRDNSDLPPQEDPSGSVSPVTG